ncbi:MAG: hypothetical protein FJW31_13705 [Acidobacteria bacterium]|nr:hypothetical protein [Acidobacteriota bacterium]
MKPGRIFLAAAVQIVLLAQESAVSFDVYSTCGSFSLESGLAMLANSYLASMPWGLLRSWFRQGQERSGGLTAIGVNHG